MINNRDEALELPALGEDKMSKSVSEEVLEVFLVQRQS